MRQAFWMQHGNAQHSEIPMVIIHHEFQMFKNWALTAQ